MKCPECQHASAEKNAKFCSQCGFRFVQLSGQPQQKPSVPVEEQRMASMVTETTNASAKQPNEETKGNPKKKKKKKKKKKSTKENKGPAPSKSDQMTSDLSDMSLIDMKGIKEQGREASDSESSISDMDETLDSLQDQGNTPEEPCTGCPLDETAARQAHCPAPIGPATQSEGDPATPPGNLTLGEVRQQTVSEDKEGKKDALNVQRACADQNTDVDQNTSVDQNANMTNQIKQKTQQAQQSRDTKPSPAGDQTMVFGPQIKTQEKKKKKKNENKGPKSLEVDQMTSDLSDVSLIDRKRKKEQGGEASDGESSISDMCEAPDSLQDQGKTPDEPCTGCPLDETGACQAHPPAPIGPATQEASPEESQPACQQPTKPEQPVSNEALATSPAPPSQSERDPANPPGTQSPGGVRQRTDSKNNKGKNDAVNTRRACADQNTSVDQNANMTSQIKQKTQQAQQSRDTKPGPAGDQNMGFGSQQKPQQSKEQASSRTSSGTDPKVEQEQPQKKSSSSKEDPSKGKETDTEMKDAPPPEGPPAMQHIPASDRLTIYFHAVLSKDFKFDPDNDRIYLQAGDRIGTWNSNAVELTVPRDLGEHGFFVEGKLVTTRIKAASVSIPYKYVVFKGKKSKYVFEYVYKLDSKDTTNRCLFVKPHLLNEEGEWHQYDDIICVEPSKNIFSRGIAYVWADQKKNIIHGREIAGRIMLGTIFDLLSSWSEINLKSFLSQLNQFYQVYAHPYVYEETSKKWDSLDYGEEQVSLLLKQVVVERVTPQLGKDSSGRDTFIKDPLYAAVIVLYIWSTYKIRLDNGELSRLCIELCLPELPKDDFFSYWADFVVSFSHIKNLSEMVRSLVDQVKTKGMPHWILAVPLLHLLRELSAPFEPISCTNSPTYDLSWAGLRGLKSSSGVSSYSQDRRAIIKMMETRKHLFQVDVLLARSCMWVMTVEELVECGCIAQIGLLDLLQAFHLKAPADVTMSYMHVSDVITYIQKNLVEQQYSFQGEDYGRACLTTAIKLLEKICRGVKTSGYKHEIAKIPVACMNMVASVSDFFLSCQPQETDVGGAKMTAKDRELLGQAMNIMRRWVSQTFRNRLTTGIFSTSFASEIEMWNNIISLSFKNEEFTKEWRLLFTTDLEGKFEKEPPLNQIEIYGSSIEKIDESYPHVANCIEKCALQAVTYVCQTKAEAEVFEKIKINWKFGKLVSTIIEKSWPRDARGHYLEREEVILQHMLNWTAARNIFELHGADEKLMDKLSKEAKELMDTATLTFTSIYRKVLSGAIEIKLLNHILENQNTFIELLTIDCLSDNEKCKDSSAMRRLLQWRRDEVEAVYRERKLVESLITMSDKLQEHIAVSMDNLEAKRQINIEVMTLDQFMDVQKFDTFLSDTAGVVTFFNLDQNTKEMAKVLCMLKGSFIFCMCWENQAKELSRRNPHNDGEDDDEEDDYNEDLIVAEEEQELQLVATLPVIYNDIYQPSYAKYEKIYSDLKSGALKLGEVDIIFKAYKGKYEELRNELEIMCRTDQLGERNWIQRRVGQIEQYHEVHLAVESALVIKKVKDTLCLQGDFKVLDMLLEVADVNFKKESLDRIDNNLIQAKRDMVEITEQRLLCLQELGERKNFVMWVKEALEDINELKVFVDLASISAGENDLDVDRVACFHDAVLGYSPMLYELKPNSGFDVFKETLKKLWKALDNDHNLPKKLRDTARHLEWLKTVKESHGSVELSSLSLASAINKKGIYIISAQNQKKLSLDTALKLKIPEEHEDGQEMRCYSLEELRELQNKLMLMSGKGEQGQGEVEHFVEDGWEAVLDTTALVRSCVQSAVRMLKDQGEGGARSTRRVEILLTLLADSEELKAAFLTALKRRLHTLLVSYDGKSFSSKNWVINEASNVDALQEGGTFRHALWKRVQAVVTPLLAQLVAVADRDCNLDLLLDHNSGEPVRKLWLDIFRDEKLLEVPFAAVDRNSESKTILVQSYITPQLGAGCSLPFSWRVRDYLEELRVHAQHHEGHTVRQFEDFFRNTPLGRYIAEAAEETQREFFQRYLQDFVCMTMKVTSEEELQLLCTALTCCVNELRIREDVEEDEVISLPWVHAAHQEFKNRLQNLSRMVAMEPKVALHLQRIEGSREGPEMVLDVFAALACVELLEPRGLDSDRERLAWLRQVKRLQGPVELACSEEICSRYGERSRERARTVRRGWSRIFSLSLFVEHMLVGIEGVEEKLRPLLLERTRVLGQVLGTNSDLKMEPPFLAVIGIIKACMDGANDRIFKFGRQPCPVCMGDPHEPLSLPCHHIYCLACIRQWLIPGQMYCPLCKQEVPDDFNLATSEDIRLRIVMYSQFRKRCNAFFIDMVSTVCFKDNAPPSSEVIQHLLSYLMVAVEAVHTIRARTPVFTKALSPFDDSVDKNPVVRSVILKLLLKYSFAEVKDYLQQHLSDVERSNILDEGDKSELYSLYINCLQDSMLERTQCRTATERTACLQDERTFLKHFLKHFLRPRGVRARATTIEHLQEVARVRLCLDMAAHLMADQQTNPGPCEGALNAVSAFLGCVADLCVRSGNGWYRVYLIRKVCSQQGMEFVQKLQATAELRWLFPEELLQNQEGGQMDHFLVWGEDYRTIREAVAKAMMKGGTEGIEEACERCGGTPAKKTVLLLLALFREVTTLYRTANHSLHPKQELLHALKGFIQGSRVLVRPEAQAFALALVHNQLGALTVGADRPGVVHGLVELTVHLAAVLMTVNHGCLAPLRLLALSPARMQAAFLPTMPEDMLAVARAALGPLMWYYCPNGHPCTVGECGRPMEVRRCLDCNLPVGGSNHQPLQGFNPVNVQVDRTQSGHVLGDPGRRDMPDMLDTKGMSPAPFTLVRLLTHLSMLIGASEHPQVIAQIIKPPVADPGSFLIGHLLKDMEQLGRVLGKGSDDTVSMAHLTVLSLLDANPPTQWPVSHNDVLSTKEARNAWETGVASDIIVPQLKTLERQLKEANDLIRTDSRVSSSPVMRLVFGDPRLTLATLPRDSPIHSGAVWSCRERVSLRALAHVVEQNDGRDALPVLWRFLHKEPELRLVRFLPEILALQRELVKKFQNAPDVTCSTIHEFIQGLTAASLKTWYETRIKIFLKTWNQLRQSLATKGELKIPAELCQTDLGHSSDLQVLLPRRQGQGLCATALVSYLIALHNEQVHAVDKHTGEETSYTVSPADLSDLHVIRYELERDLLPLVLSHCQYSVERGQETISEYDLPKIQQQVVTRFLQGKPLISLVGIPTLVNRHDRNYVNIFKDVKDKVGQEALPALTLAALAGELAAYSDVCEALEVVEVALGFLAMTGENPDMQLVCYLRDVLQMGDRTAPHILKALSRCSLKHCAAVWQLLASLKSENMLRLKRDPFVGVLGEYKKPLSEEERGLLMAFLSKGSVDTCLLEMHEFLLLHLKDAQALEMYRASWGLKETLVPYIERKDVDVPPDVELLPDEICLSKFVEAWKLIAAFRQNRGRR
ncbi:E3 ubiquitin-protein ligase rnf213-alpha-like isoform X6 [Anguilla anguilla]|uniref:E3 ubiquitin-protein ligase rnf213-alpha-like isoform X6 n=1 Tax=Anguilla anguilla TaxID=7936 RepID=UPI0015AE0DBB|nr:E3 ubiquitin-protein ligase rnf213-alpha-like isoform X6 [Anguilla anguilla]